MTKANGLPPDWNIHSIREPYSSTYRGTQSPHSSYTLAEVGALFLLRSERSGCGAELHSIAVALDKLEQLRKPNPNTTAMVEELRKRARRKFLSTSLASELIKIDSPLNKSYALTFGCCRQIYIDNDQVARSMFYCKKRWCQVCAAISMGTQINNWYYPISQLPDLYFATLTVPNTHTLASTIEVVDRMQKVWRQILDLARKSEIQLNGIRKLELKVGKGGGYHPHFHIIISGGVECSWLVTQWLWRFKESNPHAQNMQAVTNVDSALLELMKYATKLTCADDTDNNVLCTAYQMDVIFQVLHKRRLFQSFGTLKLSSEDEFEPLSTEVTMKARGLYEWIGHDWFHTLYGQPLSNYIPEGDEIAIHRRARKL